MNADLRERIRHAVDTHARARRQAALDARQPGVCALCGCDRELRSAGCRRCNDRHRKWARRADPDFIALEREQQRRARARRRQMAT